MKDIIGQKSLIGELRSFEELPKFLILTGPKGSGKKLMTQWLTNHFDIYVINIGTSVADIRSIIQNSHTITSSHVYILADADRMSPEAKSALLKVTEEPPNKSHFIMTVEDIENMPRTIISRAFVCRMNSYTKSELYKYIQQNYDIPEKERLLFNVCETPGEVDLLYRDKAQEFYDYVDLVLDNIMEVNISNALKIGERVALKEEAEGYDLKLFWKIFIRRCMDRAKENHVYAGMALVTSKHLTQCRIRGANKVMLFADWIISVREVW